MAIEVTFKGSLPPPPRWQCTCPQCKSIMNFAKGDVEWSRYQREGDVAHFICPVCITALSISPDLIKAGPVNRPLLHPTRYR